MKRKNAEFHFEQNPKSEIRRPNEDPNPKT